MTTGTATYLVRRYAAGRLVREYGPFLDRAVADHVALRACEKHGPDALVVVEPRKAVAK